MRSDRDHCGSRVAVEQEDEEDDEEEEEEAEGGRRRQEAGGGRRRQEDEDEEEEDEEEDQATDIKSNNPHLAGGEKTPTDLIFSAAHHATPHL